MGKGSDAECAQLAATEDSTCMIFAHLAILEQRGRLLPPVGKTQLRVRQVVEARHHHVERRGRQRTLQLGEARRACGVRLQLVVLLEPAAAHLPTARVSNGTLISQSKAAAQHLDGYLSM